MPPDEAIQRLLRWESSCTHLSPEAHKQLGGRSLKNSAVGKFQRRTAWDAFRIQQCSDHVLKSDSRARILSGINPDPNNTICRAH